MERGRQGLVGWSLWLVGFRGLFGWLVGRLVGGVGWLVGWPAWLIGRVGVVGW